VATPGIHAQLYTGLEVGWDEAGWHPGSFWNGLKASCYFLAPLVPSRNVLYYYYQVRVSGVLSSSFEIISGVPQGPVLGPLLFNVFINDICDAVAHSKYLLFADDIKIFRAVYSPQDCYLLQLDINSVQGWCTATCMKLNIGKTRVISFYVNPL
jgi:hypothetical protein